jgi:uncharacterized membrane protein YhaH (DUF805 family)
MFKNAFSFNGRIRRTEFFLSNVFYYLAVFIINFLIEETGTPLVGFLYIPLFWFLLAQGAKRCHDLGKSGWWQIIPFYGLWMLFQKGQPFANEYDISGYPFYGADDYEKPFSIDPDITL